MSDHPGVRSSGVAAQLILALLVAVLAAACPSAPHPRRPNIILIIGDDHGYPDAGFMGSSIVQTPHLDRLAREGTVFTHGFATASSCHPSMISLVTGLHPEQWKARPPPTWGGGGLHLGGVATLPRLLSGAGYRTLQTGKYWGGSHAGDGFTHGTKHPFASDAEAARYKRKYGKLAAIIGGTGITFGRTSLQPLRDFLDESGAAAPFFVWFAPLLPHAPFDAPKRFLELYEGRGLTRQATQYFANVSRLDATVGELLADLEERGLRQSTLLVYVSDNGWEQPPNRITRHGDGAHGKLSLYEYGFRTPVIFSWPGQVAQGVVRDDLVSTVDLLPTLLDILGMESPADRHGVSLYPCLFEGGAAARRRVIGGIDVMRRAPESIAPGTPYFGKESGYFLRTTSWRYLWFVERDREELYRIEEDPDETHDLASGHPELAAQFRTAIEQWRRDMQVPFRE